MPEIFLASLDVVMNLGEPQPEIGNASIVGSAAFNLLVISGLSIYAVSGGYDDKGEEIVEIKHIDDTGVFAVTSFASCFAYIWLYCCLCVFSYGYVEMWEAIVTFAFFFVLVIIAWRMDVYRAGSKAKVADAENAQVE